MFDPMDMKKVNELLVRYQDFYLENEERFAALVRVQQTFVELASLMIPPPALATMSIFTPMFEALWFRGLVDTHESRDLFLDLIRSHQQLQMQLLDILIRPPD